MEYSRRTFLKLGVAGGGGAAIAVAAKAIPGGVQSVDGLHARNLHRDYPEEWVPSACGACPVACPILLRRIGGKIVGVRPLEPHPCLKAYVIPQEIVHPDRVRTPLRRLGKRGSGRWEPTTPAAAIEAVVRLLAEAGSRAALVVREDAALSFGLLKSLFAAQGAHFVATYDWPLFQGPWDALAESTGWGEWKYDLSHADGIISFGWDWLQAFPDPGEAQEAWRAIRERNLPMIHVGPRLDLTAMRSREWIACRPGTEALVALMVAHLLVREKIAGLAPEGLDSFDLASAERSAGVPRARLASVAQAFRKHRILALAQRGRLEDQRAVALLNGLLGHVGRPEGLVAMPMAQLPLPVAERPVETLPAEIEAGKVETVFLAGVNPAFDSLEPSRWRSALARARHVVTLSPFMDETARLADWVLPLPIPAERREIYLEWRDGGVAPRAVEPAVKSDGIAPDALAFELAARLGPDRFPWKTLEEAAGAARTEAPAAHPFRPPRVSWGPPVSEGAGFHLLLDTPLALARGHGAQHPYLVTCAGPHLREWWTTWLEINPAAASRLGIRDGDWVQVKGPGGAIRARARHFTGVPEDAVCLPLGLGHEAGTFGQKGGGNPAEVLGYRSDARTGVTLWRDQKVDVRKA